MPQPILQPEGPSDRTKALIRAALVDLGEQVHAARRKQKLGVHAAGRACDVSAKHLRDVEQGANFSVEILLKLAYGLGIYDLRIGDAATLLPSSPTTRVVSQIEQTAAGLSQLYELLTGERMPRLAEKEGGVEDERDFPPVVSLRSAGSPVGANTQGGDLPPGLTSHFEILRDIPTATIRASVSGEVAAGEPILPVSEDNIVTVPQFLYEEEEVLLRVRGESLREWGFHPGDLLVIERRDHAANGELVLALHNNAVVVGRYWSKLGGEVRLLSADSAGQVSAHEGDTLEIYGVINSKISVSDLRPPA
jgi:repressor LexA